MVKSSRCMHKLKRIENNIKIEDKLINEIPEAIIMILIKKRK